MSYVHKENIRQPQFSEYMFGNRQRCMKSTFIKITHANICDCLIMTMLNNQSKPKKYYIKTFVYPLNFSFKQNHPICYI